MAIPVFTKDEIFNGNRQAPVFSDARTMTVEGTVQKTVASFALLLVAGVVGWFIPALALPAILAAFGIGLWNAFKKEPSAPLTLVYAGLQGVALGGISGILESVSPGVVFQAVLATLSVFAVVLALFSNGKIRASRRATQIFLVATLGYMVFGLVNLGLMVFGGVDGMFGVYSQPLFGVPIGIPLGIFATLLASYSLVLDFDYIQRGVANRAPSKYEWKAAFGLVATLVWLYVEMLRLISIFRN